MSSLFFETFQRSPYPSCIFARTSLRFLAVNDAFAGKYGYEPTELLQMTVLDLYPPREREAARRVLIMPEGANRKSLLVDQRGRTGRRITMLLTLLPVDFGDQEAIYATGEEVTKRIQSAQRLRDRDREDRWTGELSWQLTSESEEDELLTSIVDAVTDLMPQADAAAVWLLDEAHQVLVCRVASNMHSNSLHGVSIEVSDVMAASDQMRKRLERIITRHKPDIIRDASAVAGFEKVLPPPLARARTRIAVPLLHRSRAIGFMAVYNCSETNVFSQTDERLVSLFGILAVAALRNAALDEDVRAISRRLLQAQEVERRRLAHELHDEIGGLLTSLRLSLRMNPAEREDAQAELREAEELVNELSTHVRQMSFRLRPNMLDDFGLIPTLEWYTTRYTSFTNITVDFKHNVPPDVRYAPEIETGVFRIVQEALTNIARHAEVDEAQVLLFHENDELEVHIIDQGRGFIPEKQEGPRESLGLVGMTERTQLLGGRMTIDSAPGAGTRVSAVLPM